MPGAFLRAYAVALGGRRELVGEPGVPPRRLCPAEAEVACSNHAGRISSRVLGGAWREEGARGGTRGSPASSLPWGGRGRVFESGRADFCARARWGLGGGGGARGNEGFPRVVSA